MASDKLTRLVRYVSDGRSGVGLLLRDGVAPTQYDSMGEVIEDGGVGIRHSAEAGSGVISDFELLTPVDAPSKILCCGINYAGHLDENPEAIRPSEPFFFSKLPSSVIGPNDPIVTPYSGCQLDYEVELAFVIGKTARNVSRRDAGEFIFGYTLLNDISARDIQFRDAQITLGKGLDTFSPIGPAIVPIAEMPSLTDIHMTTRVNGKILQSDQAGNMLFGVPELLERLSRWITLNPGDVISTGTPAGVAHFRPEKPYLKAGDVVEISATGIGELINPVL